MQKAEITVIGAGMGGTFVSYLLAKKGYKINLFEARSDIRKIPPVQDRSINQSLSQRTIGIMKYAGLWSKLKKLTITERGRVVHPKDGETFFSPYGRNDKEVQYSYNRNSLNGALLSFAAIEKNVNVRLNAELVSINPDKKTAVFKDTLTGESIVNKADFFIDASGINSKVRKYFVEKKIIKEKRITIGWSYKSLYAAPSKKLKNQLTNEAFHIWPREKCSMFALPFQNGSFVFTVILPDKKFGNLVSKSDIEIVRFFRSNFPDVGWLVPKFVDQFKNNKLGKFECIHVEPWHYKDKVVLIGDAAHAPTIFYSQGATVTFEDCKVLVECLTKHKKNYEAAFEEFFRLRKPNTEVLTNLSYNRFFELKNGFRNKEFVAKDKLEYALSKALPFYKPLYTYICHTTIPYAEAHKKYLRQQKIAKYLGMDLAVKLYSKFI